jgi:hypothetical protein
MVKEGYAPVVAVLHRRGRLGLHRYLYHRRDYPLRDRGVLNKSPSRGVCHLRPCCCGRGVESGRFRGGGGVRRNIGEQQSKTFFEIPETGNKERETFQIRSMDRP